MHRESKQSPSSPDSGYTPRLIAWEVTKRCTLHCRHCRAAAENIAYQDEFTLDECQRLLDDMTRFTPPPIMILTGGDPLLREDIFEVIAYGHALGLRMVIALCGQGLTPPILQRLKEAGILKISFSLDGSSAATHDAFRREHGSFDAVLRGMAYARQVGLPFQVNSTIAKHNLSELPDILELAIRCGADAFHPFLLVPTGNARNLLDLELSPEEYETTLHWIYAQSQTRPIMVKPTCAPHYYRIMLQQQNTLPPDMAAGSEGHGSSTGSGHGLATMTKGCLGGQGFAFISHIGKVQICGFLDVECGDVRATDFDFKTIWDNSPVFREIRNTDGYHGKCGVCEYRNVCGGCRARAYNVSGNYLDSEPFCTYLPRAMRDKPES
jgi:AdoMet-dependent heme synthase